MPKNAPHRSKAVKIAAILLFSRVNDLRVFRNDKIESLPWSFFTKNRPAERIGKKVLVLVGHFAFRYDSGFDLHP
jgi:hypothetical protein